MKNWITLAIALMFGLLGLGGWFAQSRSAPHECPACPPAVAPEEVAHLPIPLPAEASPSVAEEAAPPADSAAPPAPAEWHTSQWADLLPGKWETVEPGAGSLEFERRRKGSATPWNVKIMMREGKAVRWGGCGFDEEGDAWCRGDFKALTTRTARGEWSENGAFVTRMTIQPGSEPGEKRVELFGLLVMSVRRPYVSE